MCDYSLMNIPNRLANEGEILVTHKFSTGSIGFMSPDELCDSRRGSRHAAAGFWSGFNAWLARVQARSVVPAVCIPPGAQLKVLAIPESMCSVLGSEVEEEITFTQTTAAWNEYRDALRIRTGQEILLQKVGKGLKIKVVSLRLAEESTPIPEVRGYAVQGYTLVPRR